MHTAATGYSVDLEYSRDDGVRYAGGMPEKTTVKLPDLRGILPPITTPFNADGELDLAGLEHNIERYNAAPLAGYVAFGSNGEAAHLDAGERRQVLEVVQQKRLPGRALVAGINALSTRAAIAEAEDAARAGADAVLVITPYFYQKAMTQEVLAAFYREVADASPLPVLLYNFPQNTGVTLAPQTEVIRRAPAGFAALTGNAAILYPSLAMGATGAILAVACVAPAASAAIHAAATSGDHQRARRLQDELSPLASLVTAEYGVPGLKAALDLAGFVGGEPRGPLRPAGEAARQRLRAELDARGLLNPRAS